MTDQSTSKALYRHHGILAKIREHGIRDFSEKEQDRVFAGCVGPITCKRGLAMMIKNGLTIADVYWEHETWTLLPALPDSDRPKPDMDELRRDYFRYHFSQLGEWIMEDGDDPGQDRKIN